VLTQPPNLLLWGLSWNVYCSAGHFITLSQKLAPRV